MRGGGDLASGVIYRLYQAGFPVIVLELAAPLLVRRGACYGEAVFSGKATVAGIVARKVDSLEGVQAALLAGEIPVAVDEGGSMLESLEPSVLVDARMEKRPLDTVMSAAPLVISLGPGFTAGEHTHAVVETNRGHDLGRVIWQGAAEPDTGTPGTVKGKQHSRVLRAPADGALVAHAQIGDRLAAGQTIATVDGQPIVAAFNGVLRGLVHEKVRVWKGLKIGDLDPRGDVAACYTISDKALAVGGGVVEAVMSADVIRQLIGEGQEGHEATRSI